MSREQFLHNKIFKVTDNTRLTNYNMPKYYDIMLQVLNDCIEAENSGYSISYQSAVINFQTGSVAEFIIKPRSTITGDMNIRTFNRANYNKMLDFSMLIEGRYLYFWTSLMSPSYSALMYMAPYFPDLLAMESIFGTGPNGKPRQYFYTLNWGQRELFEANKTRILAIYTEGFSKCYWTSVESITLTADPRILSVNIAHQLPHIYLHDIDIITEYMYVKSRTDEVSVSYITNEIVDTRISFEAAVQDTYNPWKTPPPCYPDL